MKTTLNQLKNSDENFRFDQTSAKTRLLADLHSAPYLGRAPFRQSHSRQYLVGGLSVVVLVSGTFTYAQSANPGDVLFPINKFGEQIILSLPFSPQTNAQIHTNLVTKRFNALDEVIDNDQDDSLETQQLQLVTIQESDETFNQAIEAVSNNRQRLLDSGQTQGVDQMSQTLNDLEVLAQKHEQQIVDLEAKVGDPQIKDLMEVHRQSIYNSRSRVKTELHQKDDSESNSDHSDH